MLDISFFVNFSGEGFYLNIFVGVEFIGESGKLSDVLGKEDKLFIFEFVIFLSELEFYNLRKGILDDLDVVINILDDMMNLV